MNAPHSNADSYDQALQYIASRSGYERGFVADPFAGDEVAALGLLRTRALLTQLNEPDRGMRICHNAGTKGKGSTSVTVEALARAAGLRTGLYTTPHLHSFRERIQIDRQPVSRDEFAALQQTVAYASEGVERSEPDIGQPTAFEIMTAMAIEAFRRADVDLAILETGLGGRFDATNVCLPEVTAITSISYDHMAILGNTLEEIAREKAGIIKTGVPVVVGPQQPEVATVLETIATERGALVYKADRDWTASGQHRSATFTGPWGSWSEVELALAGNHQVENTGIALMTAYLLQTDLLQDEQRARIALKQVNWPGRFERAEFDGIDLIFDGAHNVDSVRRLAELLETECADRTIVTVFGAAGDKEHAGMLREIGRVSDSVIVTQSSSPRSAPTEQIAQAARQAHLEVIQIQQPGLALEQAMELAKDASGVVCITGSLYLVADLREVAGLAHPGNPNENQILFGSY